MLLARNIDATFGIEGLMLKTVLIAVVVGSTSFTDNTVADVVDAADVGPKTKARAEVPSRRIRPQRTRIW